MRNNLESDLERGKKHFRKKFIVFKELKELKDAYENEIQTLRNIGLHIAGESNVTLMKKKLNKHERLKFNLEEEGIELNKMVENLNRGQDEIEKHLRRQKNLINNVGPSGTKQILQSLLKSMKNEDDFKGHFFFNFFSLFCFFGNFANKFFWYICWC